MSLSRPNEIVVEDVQHDVPIDLDRWHEVLRAAMELLDVEGMATSLYFVDADEIAGLKHDHLGGEAVATDVLAFPIDEPTYGGEAQSEGDMRPILGDIVICPSIAVAQAPEHAGSVDDEIALLLVHGLLHLVGHDHAEPAERARMHAEERRILAAVHGPLAGDPWRTPHPEGPPP